METITIDAQGKRLGRVATEAARGLLGKGKAHFARNTIEDVTVHIVNVSKLAVTDKKLTGTVYTRYSGYPGGLKEENLAALKERKGLSAALKIAVSGMLPKNKLRDKRMMHLKLTE